MSADPSADCGQCTDKRYRFFGLIQAGYRQLIKNLHEENVIDLDSPPTAPVTVSSGSGRPLSRVASIKLVPDADGEPVEGFGHNAFTTVPVNYTGGDIL